MATSVVPMPRSSGSVWACSHTAGWLRGPPRPGPRGSLGAAVEGGLQGVDGRGRGHLAGGVAAHPVGHREERGGDQQLVLVVGADHARCRWPTPAAGRSSGVLRAGFQANGLCRPGDGRRPVRATGGGDLLVVEEGAVGGPEVLDQVARRRGGTPGRGAGTRTCRRAGTPRSPAARPTVSSSPRAIGLALRRSGGSRTSAGDPGSAPAGATGLGRRGRPAAAGHRGRPGAAEATAGVLGLTSSTHTARRTRRKNR